MRVGVDCCVVVDEYVCVELYVVFDYCIGFDCYVWVDYCGCGDCCGWIDCCVWMYVGCVWWCGQIDEYLCDVCEVCVWIWCYDEIVIGGGCVQFFQIFWCDQDCIGMG